MQCIATQLFRRKSTPLNAQQQGLIPRPTTVMKVMKDLPE